MDHIHQTESNPPEPEQELAASSPPPVDIDACPRCEEPIEQIIWGQTNCPRCGLHFECC